MREIWLRANTRLFWPPAVVATVLLLAGTIIVVIGAQQSRTALLMLGIVNIVASVAVGITAVQARSPRIRYQDKKLLLGLGEPRPVSVPIDIVECFLMGRGPSFLPGQKHENTETITFIVRLRETDERYAQREINRRLGTWCGHHVTLRGTWCEPLSVELVTRLNERLASAQREAKLRRVS